MNKVDIGEHRIFIQTVTKYVRKLGETHHEERVKVATEMFDYLVTKKNLLENEKYETLKKMLLGKLKQFKRSELVDIDNYLKLLFPDQVMVNRDETIKKLGKYRNIVDVNKYINDIYPGENLVVPDSGEVYVGAILRLPIAEYHFNINSLENRRIRSEPISVQVQSEFVKNREEVIKKLGKYRNVIDVNKYINDIYPGENLVVPDSGEIYKNTHIKEREAVFGPEYSPNSKMKQETHTQLK